jgi:peptidyl-prolyl cis-trans isomerase C
MKSRAMAGAVTLIALLALTACASAPTPTSVATLAPQNTTTPQDADSSEPSPSPTETEELSSPTPEPPLAVRVNGQPLYLADYEHAVQQYEADLTLRDIDSTSEEGQAEMDQAKPWILNVMIEQILIEQEAAKLGVVVSDAEVDAYLQTVIEENDGEEAFLAELAERGETYESAWKDVRIGLLGMAMTQRVVDAVPTISEHVHARHILVDTLEEGERVLSQLQASADFASLSQAYSQDLSTRDRGGDLGFFPRGILVAPEVEEVAFALQPGQFSGVISSTLGYHIVQVTERDPAREVSPENLRLLQEGAVLEWVEGLWASASVERYVEANP